MICSSVFTGPSSPPPAASASQLQHTWRGSQHGLPSSLVNTETGEKLALPLGEASVILVSVLRETHFKQSPTLAEPSGARCRRAVLVVPEARGHHALGPHLPKKNQERGMPWSWPTTASQPHPTKPSFSRRSSKSRAGLAKLNFDSSRAETYRSEY